MAAAGAVPLEPGVPDEDAEGATLEAA